ncbi:MAG TPA: sigma factor, partial [Candidatus Paceibacterota bacterium]|nr:sigma factor [Candidatus Paceibacterota bacterium]
MATVDCKQKTDEELVAAALNNPDFFACLVEKYEAPLRRYCRRLIGYRHDEDDILQDVFLKCYLS